MEARQWAEKKQAARDREDNYCVLEAHPARTLGARARGGEADTGTTIAATAASARTAFPGTIARTGTVACALESRPTFVVRDWNSPA